MATVASVLQSAQGADATQPVANIDDPHRQPAAAARIDALYALRACGEPVDAAEIDRQGREAVRAVVRRQREAGIDVGNNGDE